MPSCRCPRSASPCQWPKSIAGSALVIDPTVANRRLDIFAVPDLPMVQPGDDLAALIAARVEPLRDHDVVVIAQKIVSKAEGRIVDLATVTPSPQAIDLAREVEKDPRLVEAIL